MYKLRDLHRATGLGQRECAALLCVALETLRTWDSGRRGEVERRLVELPRIVDACVLGVSCDRRGQEVVAFVVREDSALTPLVLRQLCAATLSAHKLPRRFLFVDRLPVDSRGKVERRALQALASRVDEA
jgi:acyl-coenzyme A synthetase/AMP-(fatty) acid ligase